MSNGQIISAVINAGMAKRVMTSLDIAEITGKLHKNVMRDIRNLLEQGVAQLNFEPAEYCDKKGEKRPCFNLTPKGCLILASGYNPVLREKIIDRLEILEKKNELQVPQSFSEALLLAAKQQQEIEAKQRQIETQSTQIKELDSALSEMQPKITYLDMILSSKDTMTITQIAQDYGMSAKAFNKLLESYRVQRKVNGSWIVYAPYLAKGYVQSETFTFTHADGTQGARLITKWTQRGRLFLYEQLKKKNIVPLIEQICD